MKTAYTIIFSWYLLLDVNKGGLLNLIKSNIQRNKDLIKHPVKVVELDFMEENISTEIMEALPKIKIIIAADGK